MAHQTPTKSSPIPWCWPKPQQGHDPVHIYPGFETSCQSQEWRNQRALMLTKGKNANPALAEKLQACRKGSRCGSLACPECWRGGRRWETGAVMALLEKLGWSPGQGYAFTAIPTWLACAPGHLETHDLHKTESRLRTALARSEIADLPIIGGWDFSFNEHGEGSWTPHWQPHLYLLLPTATNPELVKRSLESVLPRSEACPRPLKYRSIDDAVAAITYAFKGNFKRRISYFDKDDRLDSRQLPLRPEQERELLTYLDQLAMTDRMFLRNVRRRGGRLVMCQRDCTTDIAESI